MRINPFKIMLMRGCGAAEVEAISSDARDREFTHDPAAFVERPSERNTTQLWQTATDEVIQKCFGTRAGNKQFCKSAHIHDADAFAHGADFLRDGGMPFRTTEAWFRIWIVAGTRKPDRTLPATSCAK